MIHNKTHDGSKNTDEYLEEEEQKSETKTSNILENEDSVKAASERKIVEDYIEYDDNETGVKQEPFVSSVFS